MSFTLRKYQQEAVDAGVNFFQTKDKKNAIMVLGTGSGKSLIIANIAKELNAPILILSPTQEITVQNYEKYISYGYEAGIYSASVGRKDIQNVTFAMIGSIITKISLFQHYEYLIIDECDTVNAKGGQYERFIKNLGAKVCGLTASPYRLSTDGWGGSQLKFLTRTRPRIFDKLIYYTQNRDLFNQGYLCKLKYYSIPGVDADKIKSNSTGAEYDEKSLQSYYETINFPASIVRVVSSLMRVRKNVLIFTRFINEAQYLADTVPGVRIVTGETPTKERKQLLSDFKAGKVKAVANVGVLTIGFDYPELETVVIARPTMSLRLYYQMIGRTIRPHATKQESWVIDLGDNLRFFGKVEDMEIKNEGGDKWYIDSNGKKLTNKYFER